MRSEPQISTLIEEFPELAANDVNWDKEVYAHFGLLFSGYALLEASLQNCFVFREVQAAWVAKRVTNHAEWIIEYDLLEKKAFSQTFGNLIRLVSNYTEFQPHSAKLKELKRKRDYFAHHFFREEMANMLIPERVPSLVAALNRQRQAVNSAELLCQQISEEMIKSVAPAMNFDEEVLRTMASLKASLEVNDTDKFGWEAL